MSIEIVTTIATKASGDPPTMLIVDDIYFKGGFRPVADEAERNAIEVQRRKIGMHIYCIAENKYYKLVDGITNDDWEEFILGGSGSFTPRFLLEQPLSKDESIIIPDTPMVFSVLEKTEATGIDLVVTNTYPTAHKFEDLRQDIIANFVVDTINTSGHFTDSLGTPVSLGTGNSAEKVKSACQFSVTDGLEVVVQITEITGDGTANNSVKFTGDLSTGIKTCNYIHGTTISGGLLSYLALSSGYVEYPKTDITVTISPEYTGGGCLASKLLDGNPDTFGASNGTTARFIFDLDTPEALTRYDVGSRYDNLGGYTLFSWTFEGFNGTSWEVLDTITSYNWGSASGLYTRRSFEIENKKVFSRYCINASASTQYAYIMISEIFLFSGNRILEEISMSGVIASATSSASYDPTYGYTPQYAIDGNLNTLWASLENPGTVRFILELAVADIVEQYAWAPLYTGQYSATAWTYEGSNDGINWTVIDRRSGISTIAKTLSYFDISNLGSYKYYSILMTAISSYNRYQIAEFKLLKSSSVGNSYTGSYLSTTTTASSGFIAFNISSINSAGAIENLNNEHIYYSVSFDSKETFKVIENGEWRAIASKDPLVHGVSGDTDWYFRNNADVWSKIGITNEENSALSMAVSLGVKNQMTKTILEGISEAEWNQIGGFTVVGERIDIGVTLYGEGTTSPSSDSVTVNVDTRSFVVNNVDYIIQRAGTAGNQAFSITKTSEGTATIIADYI